MSTPAPAPAKLLPLYVLLTIPALTLVAGGVASAMAPTLLVENPAWLLALDARPRNLVLTAPLISAPAFYAIAIGRWFVADPFMYLVGVQRGDAALAWVRGKSGPFTHRMLDILTRWFDRSAFFMVMLLPGHLCCVLAGMRGMPRWRFLLANLLGTVLLIAMFRTFGDFLQAPIRSLVDWVSLHVVELTAATTVLVLVAAALRYRKHRRMG